MANDQLDIKVKVTPEIAEVPKASRARVSKMESADTKAGRKPFDASSVQKQLEIMEALAAKTELTSSEYKQLKKAVKEFDDEMSRAAQSTESISKEMQELIDKQKAVASEFEKISKQHAGKLSSGKYNKDLQQFTSLKGFNDRLSLLQVHKINKSGSASKNTFNDFETISQNMKKGVRYVTDDGRDLASSSEWKEMNKELNQANDDFKKLSAQIQALTNNLDSLNKELSTHKKDHPLITENTQSAMHNAQVFSDVDQNIALQTGQNDTSLTPISEKSQNTFGKVIKQVSIYTLALQSLKKAVMSAKNTVKELDKYLTEQAMVTGRTREETYNLLNTYQNMASQLGTTTKEVAEVSTQFLRQGKSVAETLTLTTAAISAAKVASIDATSSVDYLTTALNGFQLSATQAMEVSDKFAAIAASAAISYEEIAIALSKVASQANLAGMSIDYTTALLTKGIETTREAPETMGTALKTIIARMRELSDYGETLDGEGTINNVEAQLQYVDIALRTTNGELRSTEEVLNELGAKWSSLSSNQQAALAKALAGTRQQSRLIAMMSDYERVIELQQIAEESQGTTVAQMSTYMEGMEAALNKISTAWEKIVSSLAQSDYIIGFFNIVSVVLDKIGEWLENDTVIIALFSTALGIGILQLNNKITEFAINQKIYKLQQKENKLKELSNIQAQKSVAISQKQEKQDKLNLAIKKRATLEEELQNAIKSNNLAEKAKLEAEIAQVDAEIKSRESEVETQQKTIDILQQQENYLQRQPEIVGTIKAAWLNVVSIVQFIGGLFSIITKKKTQSLALSKAQTAEEGKTAAAANVGAAAQSKKSASILAGKSPWPIGLALLAFVAGSVIWSLVSKAKKASSVEGVTERISDLSNQIHNLQKTVTSIKQITTEFNSLDKKILKTNEDLEEMNSILEKGVELFQDEGEKNAYQAATDEVKIQKLQKLEEKTNEDIEKNIQEIRTQYRKLNPKANRDEFFEKNAYVAEADIYRTIGNIVEEDKLDKNIGQVAKSIVGGLGYRQIWEIFGNENTYREKLQKLLNQVGQDAITLYDDEAALKDRVDSYRKIFNSLDVLGDDYKQAFGTLYNEFSVFDSLQDDVLEYIDTRGLKVSAMKWDDFADNEEEGINRFKEALEGLAKGQSVSEIIAGWADENSESFNKYIRTFEKLLSDTILNISQNMQTYKSSIESIYSKAIEWNTLKDSEKASFIEENAALFQGKNGAQVLRAFEVGDFNQIESAISGSEYLENQRKSMITNIENTLQVERSKPLQDQNTVYIKQLSEYLEYLKDVNNVYKASLDTRLKQEQAAIDKYKEMLQKQQDALTESLEKRKAAYEKYFESIDQVEEDEDYESEANMLISNLSKLGSSTDANAMKQSHELEQQLRELEEKRLNTLRERAREAVLSNIDTQLDIITKKFDDLINSNKNLAHILTTESADKILADSIASLVDDGLTANGWANEIKNILDSYNGVVDTSAAQNYEVREEANSIILTLNNQDINLSSGDQQTLIKAIFAAMQSVGIK